MALHSEVGERPVALPISTAGVKLVQVAGQYNICRRAALTGVSAKKKAPCEGRKNSTSALTKTLANYFIRGD